MTPPYSFGLLTTVTNLSSANSQLTHATPLPFFTFLWEKYTNILNILFYYISKIECFGSPEDRHSNYSDSSDKTFGRKIHELYPKRGRRVL